MEKKSQEDTKTPLSALPHIGSTFVDSSSITHWCMCVLYVCIFSTLALWSGLLGLSLFSDKTLIGLRKSYSLKNTIPAFSNVFSQGKCKDNNSMSRRMQLPPLQQAILNARFQPGHTSLRAIIKYVFVVWGVLSLVICNCWIDSNALHLYFEPCPTFFIKFGYAGPWVQQ